MATQLNTPSCPTPATETDFCHREAWEIRQAANTIIEQRGGHYTAEEHSPIEAYALDSAECAIGKAKARTIEGALAKLWVALAHIGSCHNDETRKKHSIIRRGIIAEVEPLADRFDFDQLLVFGAICTLTELEG